MFDDNDEDVEISIPTPDAVLEGCGEVQLEQLEKDIESFKTLETTKRNLDYWRALLALCNDRREKLKPKGPEGRAVNSVAGDVDKILGPKSYEQLEALEKQIKSKLQSDEPIDTDYWEALLKSLLVWKAKAKLKKVYEDIKQARMDLLRQRYPEKAAALESRAQPTATPRNAAAASVATVKPATGLSAPAGSSTAPPPGTARFASSGNEDFSHATKALYEREVARGVGEDEEIFAAEEAVSSAVAPQWSWQISAQEASLFQPRSDGIRME